MLVLATFPLVGYSTMLSEAKFINTPLSLLSLPHIVETVNWGRAVTVLAYIYLSFLYDPVVESQIWGGRMTMEELKPGLTGSPLASKLQGTAFCRD